MNRLRTGAWLIAGAWVSLAGCTGQPKPPPSVEAKQKPYDDAPAIEIVSELETPEGLTVEANLLSDDAPTAE